MTRRLFKFVIPSELCKALIVLMPLIIEFSMLHSLQARSATLSSLGNEDYQICSQPPPQNWRQGAGVCLVFRKQNDSFGVAQSADLIEGYYGYPHSDTFVCLRGVINGTQMVGQGYLVSWEGSRWDFPNKPFFWDEEKRLQLEQGKQIQSRQQSQSAIDLILFQKATLNFQAFYRYQTPQMTAPQQLCDWSFEQ